MSGGEGGKEEKRLVPGEKESKGEGEGRKNKEKKQKITWLSDA